MGKEEEKLEEANQSLLLKQKNDQSKKAENILQDIKSSFEKGPDRIDRIRTRAFKHLLGPYREQIIELYRNHNIPTMICDGCQKKKVRYFSHANLKYNMVLGRCSTCQKAYMEQLTLANSSKEEQAMKKYTYHQDVIIDSLMLQCGVPWIFRTAKMTDMKEKAIQRMEGTDSFFITGSTGIGKTHMAVAIMRRYIEGLPTKYNDTEDSVTVDMGTTKPIFIEAPELMFELINSIGNDTKEAQRKIVDKYASTPFLILDDVGVEKDSDYTMLMMYLIINRRYTGRNKRTIVTSNMNLNELSERLSDRLSSRIKGLCRVIDGGTGDDKRITENNDRSD